MSIVRNNVIVGASGASNSGAAYIYELCIGNAPDAVSDNYTVGSDTTLSMAASGLLANDTDADGDSLTAILDVNAGNGDVVLNADGSFIYWSKK